MRASKMLKLGLTAAACLALAVPAKGVIAFDYPSTMGENITANPAALGSVFTVNAGYWLEVTSLGVFDVGANGINTEHPISVAIYSVNMTGTTINSGSLVVSPFTFSGTSGTFNGSPASTLMDPAGSHTRLGGIPTVTLLEGTYMIVANNYQAASAHYEGGFDWTKAHAGDTGPSANTIPVFPGAVTYLAGGFRDDGSNPASWGASLPDIGGWAYVGTATPNYAAGNFEFTPVPEASNFAVAGAGLLGLVYVGRCAYQRRKGVA